MNIITLKMMEVKPIKHTFRLCDDHSDVEVSIDKRDGNPTIIKFNSYDTNFHLIVENGEFMELFNVMTAIKEQLKKLQ